MAAKAAAAESGRFLAGALIDPRVLIAAPFLPLFIAGSAIAGSLAAESPEVAVTSAVALAWAVPVSRSGSVNPSLHLRLVARMDVLERDEHGASRLRASQEISSLSGRARKFRDWGADDAYAFRARVREELDQLAGKMVAMLLQGASR